ncbi:Alanine--tRNA ligase, partial [Cucurbita argyrosperma subsp. argyrosperma]
MRRGFSKVKGEQFIATFLSSTFTPPSLLSPPPLSIHSLTAHRSVGIQFLFNFPLLRCCSSTSASSEPSIPPFPPSSLSAMPGVGSQGVEWPADRVRDTFVRFFEDKNHVHWKSSPVVPVNDPTLLFANAGMNQFKPIFLGTADPNTSLSKLTRACNTQKCIRAGGKHNDLDDVGKDTYHHTFFEMLGNWSFGDYFKKEAITWAWELLTQVYKLPTDRFYATYFGGDEKAGLAPDTESRDMWLEFLPAERVLPFGCKDNFWEMGDTGPCGPCTEIHYDRLGGRDAARLVNNDDPTCIEIWNLVFIQFNRESDGSLKSLPAKHVDTGMGFERLTSVLQDKQSNYDTDATGARPYSAPEVAARMNTWSTTVVKVMGDVFPELKQHEVRIREIIAEEEASFGKTLLKGIEKFKKAAQDVQGKILSGQDAFILWDTYGFPLDLTQQAGGAIVMDADATAALHKKEVASTDDKFKFIWFKDHESVVKAIYTGYEFLESVAAGNEVGLVLESTSFYAEQGGQIFDTGLIEGPFGSFQVCNVQIFGGFILHIGSFNGGMGRISLGDKVICKVDYERRKLIAPNHTCTHMLNFALREILGNHVDQKGSIVLPEKLRFDFSHGKPVDPDDLRKIESIVNKQIEDELDVNAKEVTLAEAKRINGLRAVFGEVYPDPVRVVAIGKNIEELLADPDNENWLSISSELCGGTHISNTREAKAFALLSEEGIAKGIRRITAVTTDSAFKAFEQAQSLEQEVDAAFKIDGSLLEKVVASFKNRVDSAPIPAAKKAQIRAKIVLLQNELRKAQKKLAEENMQKAVKVAIETAEVSSKDGKAFCISHVNVGLDAAAVREAVVKVMEQKGISAMVFSTDETTKKAVVCAGVPPKGSQGKQLEVSEWLTTALQPLKGRCGKGKGGLATGQGTDASQIKEAMDLATSFASLKLKQ